ncbi:unnamed protein product [Larinioides sclopetarius]|uniref:Uncharacterized protein n=2 Tax=Larinioides sclopetarius TaxID=280406 RepID=A0AAV2AQ00_9ARAC
MTVLDGRNDFGLQYDKEGQENLWWREEMKNRFWMKVKCFVEKYNRYAINAVEEKNLQLCFLTTLKQHCR